MTTQTQYDVVIIGGGHNGLVAACYLSKAGLDVLVLEKNNHVGGAVISRQVFPGLAANLSEYAYLVGLLPSEIVDDLELKFETKQRAIASFTPVHTHGRDTGLLISNVSNQETRDSFKALTGGDEEFQSFQKLQALERIFAEKVWPTMLEPLVSRETLKQRFRSIEEQEAWQSFVEEPLGNCIERYLQDDLVRGLVFTDGRIGVPVSPHDESLLQNRTFIYHVIGNRTGEWRIPVGGMGALTNALECCARSYGTTIVTEASVADVQRGHILEVHYFHGEEEHKVETSFVLSNVAPQILEELLGSKVAVRKERQTSGSVFKINMLLRKLPRPRSAGYSPESVFTGTCHIEEGYQGMIDSFRATARGEVPETLPCEMYCHTLTDNTILSDSLRVSGYHTLTCFGLDAPYELFESDGGAMKQKVLKRYLDSINRYFVDPIESCLARDANGDLCMGAKSPVDLERDLGMPRGNIFHVGLSWPFAEDEREDGTWGVETEYENIFLCGAGALRGGGVSGIPGHNAAMRVLELWRRR